MSPTKVIKWIKELEAIVLIIIFNLIYTFMAIKNKFLLLILIIICLEVLIYLWSVWTSTFDVNNFFAIRPEFIYDKCSRLAGRVSAGLVLLSLLMVGYYGLINIFQDNKKREVFVILVILFQINHLIHLLFVLMRFNFIEETITIRGPLILGGPLHGFLTSASIVAMPIVLLTYKGFNKIIYFGIILFLFNVSFFIIKTFLGKIKLPNNPAYHNQLGILLIAVSCMYVMYRVYLENKPKKFEGLVV